MAKQYYLIDGYNLLHAAGYIPRKATTAHLERARQRLYRFLAARLSEAERQRTTIVFDVRRHRDIIPGWETHSGMTIRNAVDVADADTLIEQLIRDHSAPKQLSVVSSDRRLHRAARTRRAQAIDSDQFLQRMEQRSTRSVPRGKPPVSAFPEELLDKHPNQPGVIPDELAHWEQRIQELFDE